MDQTGYVRPLSDRSTMPISNRFLRSVAAAPDLDREFRRIDTNHSRNCERRHPSLPRMPVKSRYVSIEQLGALLFCRGRRPFIEDFENVTHCAPVSDQETPRMCINSVHNESFRLKSKGNSCASA